MSRKSKGFGINTQNTLLAANSAISTALDFNKNSQLFGNLNVTLISLSLVAPDLGNPRQLRIRDFIRSGMNYNNINYVKQKEEITDFDTLEELNKLEQLANSIKQNGLLNAIVVYKENNQFKLIAGERRYLACSLLSLGSIPVKILNKPPNALQIKLIQWAENCDREDLSAWDKLQNIKQILVAYSNDHCSIKKKRSEISSRELAKIINIKKSQAFRYLSLLKKENTNKEVLQALKENKITSIKTAEFLCGVEDKVLQRQLIMLAGNKKPISYLQNFLNKNLISKTNVSIKNFHALKFIINCVMENDKFSVYKAQFEQIEMKDELTVKSAWNKLIKYTKEIIPHECNK